MNHEHTGRQTMTEAALLELVDGGTPEQMAYLDFSIVTEADEHWLTQRIEARHSLSSEAGERRGVLPESPSS